MTEKKLKANYKIGQPLWYISNDRVESGLVCSINVIGHTVYYGFSEYNFTAELRSVCQQPEERCFLSKAELIKSL